MGHNLKDRMWADALDLLDQVERTHRAMFRPGSANRPAASWEPPVDLFETDRDLWIQVALPGVMPERLKVLIDGQALVVAGDRPLPLPSGAGVIHRLEMPHGRFERRIGLPPGSYELGRRELAHGCLTLILHKLV